MVKNPVIFSRNGVWRVRGWAALLFVLGAALVLATTAPYSPRATVYGRTPQEVGHRTPGDIDAFLYRDIVTRVARGEDYWSAAAAEHRRHHYPTSPAVVFRQPTLSWLLASLRTEGVARLVLGGIALTTSFLTWLALRRTEISTGERIAAVTLQLTGLGFALLPLAILSHEVWAGCLIAISLSLWRLGALIPAVVAGVLACLLRELALPFLGAMAACALLERQKKDALAWAAGAAIFVSLFALHLAKASHLHLDIDSISPGWGYAGGWRFAVRMMQNNLVLASLPDWVTALMLLSSLGGFALAGDRMFRRAALIISGYVMAFMFVGRIENLYWGLLCTPLLPIGVPLVFRVRRILGSGQITERAVGVP